MHRKATSTQLRRSDGRGAEVHEVQAPARQGAVGLPAGGARHVQQIPRQDLHLRLAEDLVQRGRKINLVDVKKKTN